MKVSSMDSQTALKIEIRPARSDDMPAIDRIFRAVVRRGDTFAFAEGMTEAEVRDLWMGPGCHAFVACRDEEVLGSYTFHPNQPGRGSHVANAAYIVDEAARGQGIGRMLGAHSLIAAKEAGFAAMQFNIVVSTNEPAVRLWQGLGFRILGTTPRAFEHPALGQVDAHIMHRFL